MASKGLALLSVCAILLLSVMSQVSAREMVEKPNEKGDGLYHTKDDFNDDPVYLGYGPRYGGYGPGFGGGYGGGGYGFGYGGPYGPGYGGYGPRNGFGPRFGGGFPGYGSGFRPPYCPFGRC